MKTDKQLECEVRAELMWTSINATRIVVEVDEGVVRLAGYVKSYAEKWNAEAAAKRVPGVNSLVVTLDVNWLPFDSPNHVDEGNFANNMLVGEFYR